MKRFFNGFGILLMAVSLVAAAGCSKKKGADTTNTGSAKAKADLKNILEKPLITLKSIPSDAFYVFANLAPQPKQVVNDFLKSMAPAIDKGIDQFEKMKDLPISGVPNAKIKNQHAAVDLLKAFLHEFKGKYSIEGLEKLGLKMDGGFALYGLGVMPVMRFQISDKTLMAGTIQRVLKNGKVNFKKEKFQNMEYWRIDLDKDDIIAVGLTDKEAVLGLVPIKSKDKMLGLMFDSKKIKKSMADDNKLAEIARDYGFLPYSIGFVDFQAIAAALLGDSKGMSTDLLKLVEVKIPPDAQKPECKAEIKDLVSNMKRLVVGVDKLSSTNVSMRYVVETKPKLIKELKDLASSGPGFSTPKDQNNLFAFSVNMNVSKLFATIKARVQEAKAKPYKCSLLAELNKSAQSVNMSMATLIPPVVNSITGAAAVLESITPGPKGMPLGGKGYVLVGSSNPLQLIMILQGMLPQLAGLQVKMGGGPVSIPAAALPPFLKDAKLDIQKTYVAAYVGRKSPPSIPNGRNGTEKVLFHIGYNMDEITKLINTMTPGKMEKPNPAGILDYTDIAVLVNDKGIVIKTAMKFNNNNTKAK
ncbi:MAG: hypothetical protein GXP49_03010 [Deltaproteobacteria bacterium]|nr:hypothetical protein [Deltaproteobacteria bacterium]